MNIVKEAGHYNTNHEIIIELIKLLEDYILYSIQKDTNILE